MLRTLFTFSLILLFQWTLTAQLIDEPFIRPTKPDSLHYYHWSTTSPTGFPGSWRFAERSFYTYDAQGNEVHSYTYRSQGGQWWDVQEISKTYDSFGRLLLRKEGYPDIDGYENLIIDRYSYDTSGNVIEDVRVFRDSFGLEERQAAYSEYHPMGGRTSLLFYRKLGNGYDTANMEVWERNNSGFLQKYTLLRGDSGYLDSVSTTDYEADTSTNTSVGTSYLINGGTWETYSRSTTIQDSAYNVTSLKLEWWQDEDWLNFRRYTYLYDNENRMTEYRQHNWDTATNQWFVSVYREWGYNEMGLDTLRNYINNYSSNDPHGHRLRRDWDATGRILWEQWDRYDYSEGGYEHYYNITFDYTLSGQPNRAQHEFWVDSSWAQNAEYEQFYYNQNDSLASYVDLALDTLAGQYAYGDSTVYFYDTLQSVGFSSPILTPLEISVYPNPCSDLIQLSISEGAAVSRVQLIDAQGTVVRTTALRNQQFIKMDIHGLPSGPYWARVVLQNGVVRALPVVKM
ncbi:MAG: T9SS type A sorting domain-containing protein [Cryomorphaceae bacterium]